MALFLINKEKLNLIDEIQFKYEKEIQLITENNLSELFGLDFVKSEFQLNNFRIDTLAFDKQTNSFVIIEYKRDKNFSVIDQGYAYLSLMLNNKADFILEFNENNKNAIRKNDVDWSQSKVIFIAPQFTTYQIESINFKDLPIELWEIKKYSNHTVNFNQIQRIGASESIKTVSKQNKDIDQVNKEIKVYTENDHFEKASDETIELYEKIRDYILNIADDISVKPKKIYIAFIAKKNIADIQLQKNSLKLWINLTKNQLSDLKKITRDVSNVGHHGNGDYELTIENDNDIEYIISLIKQSYYENKK